MTDSRESAAELDSVIDALLREPGRPLAPRRSLASQGGELTATARLLYDALPRFHPRFGFEEHLARRLAELRSDPVTATPASPTPIHPLPLRGSDELDPVAATVVHRRRRGLVAGGAIASGVSIAIPIAGAALVMWRRSRSSGGLL